MVQENFVNMLSFSNAVFSSYAFWGAVLVIKCLLMSTFTGLNRIIKRVRISWLFLIQHENKTWGLFPMYRFHQIQKMYIWVECLEFVFVTTSKQTIQILNVFAGKLEIPFEWIFWNSGLCSNQCYSLLKFIELI